VSYDLFFLTRDRQPPLTIDDFRSYFGGRDHFSVHGDDADQALYENDDTGVYFSFRHSGSEDATAPEEPDDDLRDANVSFNLNYWRPHVFGLEAEPEVGAFVTRFALLVEDPQTEGMGRGAYSPSLFLAGWNAGNRFAYRAFQEQLDEPPASLPHAEIDRCWRWNRRVRELQRRLGDDVFVPRISFVRHRDRVASYVVWGDGLPIALPRTDLMAMVRERLGSTRGLFRKRETAVCWVERGAVEEVLADGRHEPEDDCVVLDYEHPPEAVVTAFVEAPASEDSAFVRLPVDQVLDAELLAETSR
jgi:hypothetical protein